MKKPSAQAKQILSRHSGNSDPLRLWFEELLFDQDAKNREQHDIVLLRQGQGISQVMEHILKRMSEARG